MTISGDKLLHKRIGTMICFVIKEANLDYGTVSKTLGITELTLARIIKGQRPLRCTEWIYLCEKTGLAYESLLKGVVLWSHRDDYKRGTIKWN
jgi:plasmid maintenance system antidote protein VapI